MKKTIKFYSSPINKIFCLLILLSGSCNGSIKNEYVSNNDSDIVIIVKDDLKSGLLLQYTNKFNDNQIIYPNAKNDTIKLKQIEFVPLNAHFGKNNIMYPLQKGDSLLVTLNSNGELKLHITNDKKKEFDTLFLKFCNVRLSHEYDKIKNLLLTSSTGKPKYPNALVVLSDDIKDKKYYTELYEQSTRINELEWGILDSLKKINKISSNYQLVYGALINSGYINNIIKCYSNTKSLKYLKKVTGNKILFNDEYLKFDAGEYKVMLNRYIEQIIAKGKFHKYGANAITIDFKEAFDSVKSYINDENLSDYVKFICLKNIKSQSTTEEFDNCLLKFSDEVKDTSYVNYFNQNFTSKNAGSDALIYYIKNEKLNSTLTEIITKNVGNVIYIDLWASWCAPCRAAMPASKKLQREFKDKRVKFIYLSLDENIADWKNAAMLEGLSEYPDSYLIADQKSFQFLKDIKLEEIPRYIIVNKSNKIINTNAPPPDSKELKNILNQLLK